MLIKNTAKLRRVCHYLKCVKDNTPCIVRKKANIQTLFYVPNSGNTFSTLEY